MDRPELNNQLDSKTFREYYYLKMEQKEFPTFYDSTSYNSTRSNVLTKKNKNKKNNNVNKKDV